MGLNRRSKNWQAVLINVQNSISCLISLTTNTGPRIQKNFQQIERIQPADVFRAESFPIRSSLYKACQPTSADNSGIHMYLFNRANLLPKMIEHGRIIGKSILMATLVFLNDYSH